MVKVVKASSTRLDLEVRVGSQALLFEQNGCFWITTLGDGLRRAPYPSRPKWDTPPGATKDDRFRAEHQTAQSR